MCFPKDKAQTKNQMLASAACCVWIEKNWGKDKKK